MFALPLLRVLAAAFLSFLSFPFASAQEAVPEVRAKVNSGWQEFTFEPMPWNSPGDSHFSREGIFNVTILPGQNASLVAVDGGAPYEGFRIWEVSGNPYIMSEAERRFPAYPQRFDDYDSALNSSSHARLYLNLPPGDYKLRFALAGGDFNKSDAGGLLRAAFRIELTIGMDADGDQVEDEWETNTGIYVSPVNTGTDPNKADSDGDGLDDREEIFTLFTDPNKQDTDGDGYTDRAELLGGKSPLDPHSKPEPITVTPAIELTIYTEIGKNYQIEWTEDLVTWTAFPEVIVGDGTSFTRFYSTKEHPTRLYRTAAVPATPE